MHKALLGAVITECCRDIHGGMPHSTATGASVETLQNAVYTLATDRDRLWGLLAGAENWIRNAPHGENCYLSHHYDGDPGDGCNCGKESLLDAIEGAAVQPSAITDTARLDFLERWVESSRLRGFTWDTFTFHTQGKSVRGQLDDQMAAGLNELPKRTADNGTDGPTAPST